MKPALRCMSREPGDLPWCPNQVEARGRMAAQMRGHLKTQEAWRRICRCQEWGGGQVSSPVGLWVPERGYMKTRMTVRCSFLGRSLVYTKHPHVPSGYFSLSFSKIFLFKWEINYSGGNNYIFNRKFLSLNNLIVNPLRKLKSIKNFPSH